MKTFRSRYVLSRVIPFAMATLAIITAPAAAQGPSGAPVTVQNTPLPVTVTNAPSVSVANVADVKVTNTPTVNVGAMPAVGLAEGATVKVGNDVFGPVPTRDASSVHVIQRHGFVTLPAGTIGGSSADPLYVVPAGWRLVIEYFSCVKASSLLAGDYMSCGIVVEADTFTAAVWAGSAGPYNAPVGPGTVAGPVKLFFDSGRQVRAAVSRFDGSLQADYAVTFAGHLVAPPY